MRYQKIEIPYKIVTADAFSETERALHRAARAACENAYAPYSRFSVGCAVLLEDGHIISGSNQENAAYPSGLCAERVTLFYAGAHAPRTSLKALFIVTIHPQGILAPCGACRQVMNETAHRQEQPFSVYFPANHGSWIYVEDARALLPFPFQFPSEPTQ